MKIEEKILFISYFIVVQSLSHIWLFVTPWTAACQAPLSFTISQSLLRFMFIESVVLSIHLMLCCPLLLFSSVFPSIRVFSNESALRIRLPKYWSFSLNTQDWSPLGCTEWISLQSKGLLKVFSNTTAWMHQFFGLSLFLNIYILKS